MSRLPLKLLEILDLLSRNGLPVVPDADLPAYLDRFSSPIRNLLVAGMQAVFQGECDMANQAFQAASGLLHERGRERGNEQANEHEKSTLADGQNASVRMVKVHARPSSEGFISHFDVASHRQGDLRFVGVVGDPGSTLVAWAMHDSTQVCPTGKFTLLGTRLPAGLHDVGYIESQDKVILRIKPRSGDFYVAFVGEVVSVALENSAKATVTVRHQFGRWADEMVSIHEKPRSLHLRELLEQLAERSDLSAALVEVTDAANVALGKFRAHHLTAYTLVNALLAEFSLYGEFSREGSGLGSYNFRRGYTVSFNVTTRDSSR
ncbi:MAG: hypothetical protein IPK80_29125 [Nannocystis sp.]|nr:hypothetical protein [Nannocystis sp.]